MREKWIDRVENKSSHISKQIHVVQQKTHVRERKNIKNKSLPSYAAYVMCYMREKKRNK